MTEKDWDLIYTVHIKVSNSIYLYLLFHIIRVPTLAPKLLGRTSSSRNTVALS